MNSSQKQIGYIDAGYLSDQYKARSLTGYLFTCGDTTISWRSMKQTLVVTSSNHAEIIAIHEASRNVTPDPLLLSWCRNVTPDPLTSFF